MFIYLFIVFYTSVFVFVSKLIHGEEKHLSLAVDLFLVISLLQAFLLLVSDNFKGSAVLLK